MVRVAGEGAASADTLTANLEFGSAEFRMRVSITVPTAPVRTRQALPVFQSLADQVVDRTVEHLQRQGERISCKKGCAACCRQLVPVGPAEAHALHDLVERLPEPRRSAIRARFAAAQRRLEEAGLLHTLRRIEQLSEERRRALGIDYFALGLACPFLEDECCSIHPERPIACREYLVTSPAENCSRPSPETVRGVQLPLKVWTAVARLDDPPDGLHPLRWVPLVLALEWAIAHRAEAPPRPGPDLVRGLLRHLTGKDVPPPP